MRNQFYFPLCLHRYPKCSVYLLWGSALLLTATFLLLVHPMSSMAQRAADNEGITKNSKVQQSGPEDEYKFLKEQTKEFRDYIERERRHHQEFLQWSIYLIGIIITIMAAIFGLIGLKSVRDAKRAIEASIQERFNLYIEENVDKIRLAIDGIAEGVIQERLNMEKNICFLVPNTQRGEIEVNEIEILKKRGFENIEIRDTSEFVNGRSDLVIFCFDESQDDRLTALVSSLEKDPKPLIVYTKGRVENNALMKYQLHLFANTPLTLANWVFTTLSNLGPRRGIS